jgi:hypothetical protein
MCDGLEALNGKGGSIPLSVTSPRHGKAWLGGAGQGKARHGLAWLGKAGQGRAGLGEAGLGVSEVIVYDH